MRINCTVINEVSAKYNKTRDFINKGLNELCSEHGISAEEVRLYIFYVCYATYAVQLCI